MDLVVYDDDEKRYVPWAVALAGVLLVALLTAGLTFLLAQRAAGAQEDRPVGGITSPEAATGPTAGPGAPASPAPGCASALARADAALERSVAIEEALAAHTGVVDELLAERIDAQEALDRSLPILTDGATQRERFEEALRAYRQAREDCRA